MSNANYRPGCSGKRKFESEGDAGVACAELFERNKWKGSFNYYPCAWCAGYHIGTDPGEKMRGNAPERILQSALDKLWSYKNATGAYCSITTSRRLGRDAEGPELVLLVKSYLFGAPYETFPLCRIKESDAGTFLPQLLDSLKIFNAPLIRPALELHKEIT
jgi:hypothetical protein